MRHPDMISLKGCKPFRITSRGITDKHLAKLTGIKHDRIVVIESLNNDTAEEPWLGEAAEIGRVLKASLLELLGGVYHSVADIPTGYDIQDPLDVWMQGCRLPLRYGVRLAALFGLDCPFDLLTINPVHRRIWGAIEAGERLGRPGTCPYCGAGLVGDAGHLPSCLPALLYHPRDRPLSTIGAAPKPLKPHVRRGGSHYAPGLLDLRTRLGLTQVQMGESIGIANTTYQRIEKLHDPLTRPLADKIAALYKVTVEELYP